LVTSTPVLEGRSFGTNVMEAGLIAAAGKGRRLSHDELRGIIQELGLRPALQSLA
jgi:signal transduction histidine kinase